jgi:Tol biopolymer transport system component
MAAGDGVVSYDVAAAGRRLVYLKGRSDQEPRGVYLVDLHGKTELLSRDARLYGDPAVSPDGKRIAVDVKIGEGLNEIWVLDLVDGRWQQLTTGQNDWQPRWKDDRTLIFVRGRDNAAASWDAFEISVSSNATPTLLAPFPKQVTSVAVEPHGSAIVWATRDDKRSDLWTQLLGRDGKVSDPGLLFDTPSANETVLPCGFSPDGRWLVYASNATRRSEVYVTDFPNGSAQHPVSSDGGTSPCWSKDGRQIFFRKGNTMMTVDVRTGQTFTAKTPRELFDSPLRSWGYDVARDGSALYVAGYEASPTSSSIVFVQDITAALPSRAKAH